MNQHSTVPAKAAALVSAGAVRWLSADVAEVKSRGMKYLVRRDGDGTTITCDCPHGRNKSAASTAVCSHIMAAETARKTAEEART